MGYTVTKKVVGVFCAFFVPLTASQTMNPLADACEEDAAWAAQYHLQHR
jgi:hypothetical protein